MLHSNKLLIIITITLLGACIGSFLNVVIYRLPEILCTTWKQQCQKILQQKLPTQEKVINLVMPRSYCAHCQHKISWQHNIPLLSFLLLRARCAYCQKRISTQYFIVELSCSILSVFLTFRYNISWQLLGALLFTWSLIPLIAIDFKKQLLPDEITLPLLWLGLIFNIFHTFTCLRNAVIGAIAGYSVLWTVTYLYKLLTKKTAMGHGDFKLLATIGAWLGWQLLPIIVLIAATLGAVCGTLWLHLKQQKLNTAIAFGPYLAIAAWFVLVFNKDFLIVI